MYHKKIIIVILFILLISGEVNSQIKFNEIMSNVKGTDSGIGSPGDRNEFIEIYNISDSYINLINWFIYDGSVRDFIIPWSDTLKYPGGIVNCAILPPHCYGIILDPEYIDYGDSVNYMPYNIPDSTYVFTISNTSFTDNGLSTNDYLFLCKYDSTIVDTFGTPNEDDGFPYDPGDGISLEKKHYNLNDSPINWSANNTDEGNSIGQVNSNFIDGAIIDSYSFSDSLSVFLSVVPNTNDNLIIQYTKDTYDTIPIDSNIISVYIDTNKYDIVNVYTEKEHHIYSVLTKQFQYIGSVVYNEFMVNGDNEWIELYNPHILDFYLNDFILINNDTLIMNEGIIPADSYLVLCEDSALLQYNYNFNNMNILEYDIFSLPDREDTFLIVYNNQILDSVIRGYTDMGERSIERLQYNREGYYKDNWNYSVSNYNATPSRINSIARIEIAQNDSIYLDRSIIEHSIAYLNIDTHFDECFLNIKIYDNLGTFIEKPIDNYKISGQGIIPIRFNMNLYSNDTYIMYIEMKNNNDIIIKKIILGIRK